MVNSTSGQAILNVLRFMCCHICLETPATATDRIFFRGNDVYDKNPNEVQIEWNRFNLTTNLNAGVTIALYGYRESTIRYDT